MPEPEGQQFSGARGRWERRCGVWFSRRKGKSSSNLRNTWWLDCQTKDNVNFCWTLGEWPGAHLHIIPLIMVSTIHASPIHCYILTLVNFNYSRFHRERNIPTSSIQGLYPSILPSTIRTIQPLVIIWHRTEIFSPLPTFQYTWRFETLTNVTSSYRLQPRTTHGLQHGMVGEHVLDQHVPCWAGNLNQKGFGSVSHSEASPVRSVCRRDARSAAILICLPTSIREIKSE